MPLNEMRISGTAALPPENRGKVTGVAEVAIAITALRVAAEARAAHLTHGELNRERVANNATEHAVGRQALD
jgi:hypothetical protein